MENVSQINATGANATQNVGLKDRVLAAIKRASAATGVDFSYLLNKANQESSLDPTAKAKTSSATGLYQFIEQTWLKTVKECGDKYGLCEVADKITIGSDGVARVTNAADRKAVLELRKNPEIAASMAAELTKTNKEQLENKVGGKVGSTELYLAHFLGAGGASQLLSAMKSDPSAAAADLLPQAASANKSVFYDKVTGAAKSVSEIYQQFAKKFDKTPDVSSVRVASASTVQTSATQDNDTANLLAQAIVSQGGQTASLDTLTFSNGVTLDQSSTSSFAAMMIAQMDMETFGFDAMQGLDQGSLKTDGERRKSILSTLAQAA